MGEARPDRDIGDQKLIRTLEALADRVLLSSLAAALPKRLSAPLPKKRRG